MDQIYFECNISCNNFYYDKFNNILNISSYDLKNKNDLSDYREINSKDIIHAYSGIRPIIFNENVKNISQLSREFLTFKNGKIFNIFGGKWTSALSISEKVAKFIQRELD